MLKIFQKILKRLPREQKNIPIKILLSWNFSRHHINCLLSVSFSPQISLPIEPPQSRAQAARLEGPGLPGALAQLLREEPATRHPGQYAVAEQFATGWPEGRTKWTSPGPQA